MNQRTRNDWRGLNRWRLGALAVGVILSAVCIFAGLGDPAQFFRAYLFAFMYIWGLSLGAMVLVMSYHLTGGAWGLLIRRFLEAQMRTMPLVALLFIPIAVAPQYLYAWASPAVQTAGNHQNVQQWYLAKDFFIIRAAVYFALWLLLSFLLSHWSARQDQSDDPRLTLRSMNVSGPGLVLLGISVHFCAIDWVMSLEPRFTSTIFGPLVIIGPVITAFSLSALLFWALAASPRQNLAMSSKAVDDLGSLMFLFVMLWAYLAWFQYMLVWMANLPHDANWYVVRFRDGWQWLALVLVTGHFVIPFFLLLLRKIKRRPGYLAAMGVWLLVMQLLWTYYLIMPAFKSPTFAEHWMDLLAPVGMFGLWLALDLTLIKRKLLMPSHDINYTTAIELRRIDEEQLRRLEEAAHA